MEKFMGFFDDFQLLNVTSCRMYGSSDLPLIRTHCSYLGVIQGTYLLNNTIETRPAVYLTPRNIETSGGWQSPAGAWRDNCYIECTGARADRFFAAFGASRCVRHIFAADISPFMAKLHEWQQIFAQGAPIDQARCALCLEEFAALLEGELNQEKNPAIHHPSLARLIRDINQAPGKNWNIAAEAARAGVTLRHWNRLFNAATGMPPHRFINLCRIQAARKLLTSTNLTIKEIAAECGFESASDFSRFFRKHTGFTPGECRRARLR